MMGWSFFGSIFKYMGLTKTPTIEPAYNESLYLAAANERPWATTSFVLFSG